MNYNECLIQLNKGDRIVKVNIDKRISFVNNKKQIQYRTYRKLLFNKIIKSHCYDRFNDIEWYILTPTI